MQDGEGGPGGPGFSSLPAPWVKGTLAGDHLRGVMGKVLLLGDPAKGKDRRVPPGP